MQRTTLCCNKALLQMPPVLLRALPCTRRGAVLAPLLGTCQAQTLLITQRHAFTGRKLSFDPRIRAQQLRELREEEEGKAGEGSAPIFRKPITSEADIPSAHQIEKALPSVKQLNEELPSAEEIARAIEEGRVEELLGKGFGKGGHDDA